MAKLGDEYFTVTAFPKSECREGSIKSVDGKRVQRTICIDSRGKERPQTVKINKDLASVCKDERSGKWTICADTGPGLDIIEKLCKGKKAPCMEKIENARDQFEFIR